MNTVSIGIDNGLFGAIVAVDYNFKIIAYQDTPIVNMTKKKRGGKKSVGHELAPVAMKEALQAILAKLKAGQSVKVWLEVAHALPQQGLSSTFKTGRGAGIWEGLVVGLGLTYDVVHAKTWTKVMLRDIPAGDPKERSMIKAQRLFGSNLPLVKPGGRVLSLDGRADAALIACYGMTQLRNDWESLVNMIKKTPVKKKVIL
jgi:hypothetical protein